MGACCSCHRGIRFDQDQGNNFLVDEDQEHERDAEIEDILLRGDNGARIRLQGSSNYVSMFTKQGKKGENQDAMTVWESFLGDKDMFFCGVFDGHGPSGHKIARYIRDFLPKKVSVYKKSNIDTKNGTHLDTIDENEDNFEHPHLKDECFLSWKDKLTKCFHEIDEQLHEDDSIESYSSGTTSVCVLKKGDHLIITNLGDSRAVLCTRDENDELISEQLTVDLKPNLPGEVKRIRNCQGRVLAMEQEPNVYRVWMPDNDCPGLAMARAFGDFCLKDFGLISTPEVTYRKLTEKDEFVVLATDGIWDVLSNDEVVKIVASARKRSIVAKLLIEKAVRAWRHKYPLAKIDDCAVICLFFKHPRPILTKSFSEVTHLSLNYTELGVNGYVASTKGDDGLDTVLDYKVDESPEGAKKGGDPLDPANRARKRRPARKFVDYPGE